MSIYGDISKRPFDDKKEQRHFQSVNMQMGRVQLDADWNEAFATLLRSRARGIKDIVGSHGSPNKGFRIGNVLILDQLESKEGWTLRSGTGTWDIEHFERIEGNGSLRIHGDVTLERDITTLLKQISGLQAVLIERLEERGITVTPLTPKLLLHYRVSAPEDAQIRLSIEKEGGADPVSTAPGTTYPCGGWQVLELDITNATLSDYHTISLIVSTTGRVYLDFLAVDPGLLTNNDFYIQGGDGTSDRAGRYYVDGLACVKEGFETYLSQKDYPESPEIVINPNEKRLAYLDAWKRTITAVEDPDILEVALDGPDTCTREQLVAQVKVIEASECNADIRALKRPDPTGRLSAKLAPQATEAECDFRPELDYTGLNNALYRIEIHDGGDSGTATFKWSCNNASDLVSIISFDPDNASVIIADDRVLCCGDLVELCDDVSDLADFSETARHGKLARITGITHQTDGIRITLDISSTGPFKDRTGRHPKLRKWCGVQNINDFMIVDEDGIPPIEQQLQHGIRLAFTDEHYYHGDYWQFTARVNTRSIQELDQAPPMGPEHHYAPLSVISKDAESEISFKGCRNPFPPLTDLEAVDISFDPTFCHAMEAMGVENVQQAIEMLCRHQGCCDVFVLPGQSIQDAIDRIRPEGGSICLAPGIHIVRKTIRIKDRKNLIIRGDGSATRVIYIPEGPKIDKELLQQLDGELTIVEEDINAIKAEILNPENEAEIEENRKKLNELDEQRKELLLRKGFAEQGMSAEEIRIRTQIALIDEELNGLQGGLGNEADLEKKKELEEELNQYKKALARLQGDMLYDLFRIESSANIRFEDFFMFAGATGASIAPANSLIAIIKNSRNVTVDRCDIINRPLLIIQSPQTARRSDSLLSTSSYESGIHMPESCIRMTDCCKVVLENNRFIGYIALFQHGEADVPKMPLLNGLRCVSNQFKTHYESIIMIEGRRVILKENDLFSLDLGFTDKDYETLNLKTTISLEGQCFFETHQSINNMIDRVINLVFRCLPEIKPSYDPRQRSLNIFILKNSQIINNRFAEWKNDLSILYSERNEIIGNRIITYETALRLPYNFNTKVNGNTFEMFTPVQRNTSHSTPIAMVEHHFSDRLTFDTNDVKGLNGLFPVETWSPDPDKEPGFTLGFLSALDSYANYWGTPFLKEAVIILTKRFSQLMGLDPTIHLIEAIIKVFSGGQDVDWVELLLGDLFGKWQQDIPYKGSFKDYTRLKQNPFIKTLVVFFQQLLEMHLVSRTVISGNRFNVEQTGINMTDGIVLGGVRISNNRITGAGNNRITDIGNNRITDTVNNRITGTEDTAILWKTKPLFSNPEAVGMLLRCLYDQIIHYLSLINDFLKTLLNENYTIAPANITPVHVFLAILMLYGINHFCVTLDDTTPDQPSNPYAGILQELIDALSALIDQLKGEKVQKTISDLSNTDDRINLNQISGRGTGIHTNIANIVIESNRIDIDKGNYATAEIFATGRYLSTHAAVFGTGFYPPIDNLPGSRSQIDHSAVLSLGSALMNLNPNQLDDAQEYLSDKAAQWIGLASVLSKIKGIGGVSTGTTVEGIPLPDEIINKIDELINKIKDVTPTPASPPTPPTVPPPITSPPTNTEQIGAASNALLSEFRKHLYGYGIILESPGAQVINNRIESRTGCNTPDIKTPAPGGILMTAGNDPISQVIYSFLIEEVGPFFNIGGQGTRFSGNSLQHGSGYGLSFSSLPRMTDVKIEHNEIQNHGLAGILFDFNKTSSSEFPLSRLRVTDNEINQCFRNKAYNMIWEPSPPAQSTKLGGLMVRSAEDINVSNNLIKACGKEEDTWPAYGTLFIDSKNIKYHGNKILENGREPSEDDEEGYFPRGGALFYGGKGYLSIVNNTFAKDVSNTLMIKPLVRSYFDYDCYEKILVIDNIFEIDDQYASSLQKIYISMCIDLIFSQNHVSLLSSNVVNWKGILLNAYCLIFNGNRVSGSQGLDPIELYITISGKGIAIGNILYRDLGGSPSVEKYNNIILP